MKKLLCLLLAGIMVLSITACGSKEEDTPRRERDTATEAPPTEAPPATDAPAVHSHDVDCGCEYDCHCHSTPDDCACDHGDSGHDHGHSGGRTGTGAGIAGTRLESFQHAVEDGDFYLTMEMAAMGMSIYMEMYTKNDNALVIMQVWGMDVVSLVVDDVTYLINNDAQIYMISDDEVAMNVAEELFEGADVDFVRNGTEEFDGRMLFFEEFINDEGTLMRFYFDGDIIAGIRSIEEMWGEEYTTDIYITAFGIGVSDDLFKIPAGYTLVDEDTFQEAMFGGMFDGMM